MFHFVQHDTVFASSDGGVEKIVILSEAKNLLAALVAISFTFGSG